MNGRDPATKYDYVIRAHQLSLDLNDIMMLINSSHDVDEILRRVVEGSSKALGCESARIAMREGDNWVIRYVSNLSDDLIGRSFTDEELPHAALAVTTRKPVAIDDAFHDDRTNTGMMKSLGIQSVLVLPLIEKDAVIGTLLYGYHSRAVSFSDAEIDYAERMATGVAIALQDARQYQDLEESKRLSDALNQIDTILFSSRDSDAIMNKMLQLATEAIGAETAVIFSREGDRWTVRHEYKLPVSLLGQSFSNTEVMHTAITAITKRSLLVQDALNSPDIDQKFVEMLGIRSLLDFPLIVKGEVIGDLTFHYHSSPVPFNERQVEFVRKLQISISLALENDRLLDTYKRSEAKLKEAEKLGKSGYFNYDVPTGKIIWSEGVFNVFGRDPKLGEPTAEEFFELYSVDPGLEAIRELVGNEETNEFDAKIKRGDLVNFIHFIVRSVKDEKGDSVAFFGTIQDVTERKNAEDKFGRLDLQLEAVLESINEGVVICDFEGNLLLMNKAAMALHGYESDHQVRGPQSEYQDAIEVSDLEGRSVPFEQWPMSRALRGERFTDYELNVRRKDTGKKWIASYSGTSVQDMSGDIFLSVITMRDITERKRAEEERDWVFEYSLDMLCVSGFDGYLKRISPSFEKTLGWSEAELLSKPFFDFVHPNDLEVTRKAANAQEEGRVVIQFENRCLCKDGSYKWLSWNSRPMVKEKLIIGVARDITERKRTMEALRQSEERFHTLFNNMIEGFCIIEVLFDTHDRPIDYRFVEVNPAFESQTGMHNAIGQLMSELAPEHEVHWFEIYGNVALTGESARFENHAEALNRWFDVSAYQVDGRDSHRVAILFNDITEAKRAEAEIQEAREYAENIVETVIEPLVVLNSDLKILTANHSFYDTFKVTPEDTIGNFIYDLGNRQWDIPKLRVLFEEILPHDTVINGYEVEHDFLDIGRKIMLLNARQIFREKIGSHIILLAMEDINERKYAVEEIKRLNVNLAERADELEAANKELETFNYTVAHDLRQPLNVMSMYCQSIKLLCGDQLKDECMGYVLDAYQATLRMDGLIGALLNFSRMGRVEPRREVVDLGMLAHEVAQSLKMTEPERQVEFRIADGIVVNGDASLLRVVLDNLLGNAWKYSGKREKAVIEFGVHDIKGVPTYFVRDNGVGFAMTDADRLFTPFERLPDAENSKGFGIGLATVERIIQKHGGKVWAEGEPGMGATFYFTLQH